MNSHSETITRLIENELSDLERSQVLASLDQEEPEQWRTLALGLLERQLITDALKQLAGQAQEKATKSSSFLTWAARAALVILGLTLGFTAPRLIGEKNLEVTHQAKPEHPLKGGVQEPETAPLMHNEEEAPAPIRGGYITANFQDGSQLIVPVSHIAVQAR